MSALGLFVIVFAPQIVGLFTADPETMRYGVSCIRILGIGYPMYAVGMVMVQALNGAGDTRTPSYLNLVAFWLTQIPLAYWLATSVDMGPNGMFTAIVLSESLLTIMAVIVFRRGTWRTEAV